MDQDFISRREHDEYVKRMEAEHTRQDKRLDELEADVKQYGALTVAVEKMAVSMEQMIKEQQSQGERLVALESHDGEQWRKIVSYTITTIVGIVIGFIFKLIGM